MKRTVSLDNPITKFVRIIPYSNWCEFDCYGTPKQDDQRKLVNEVKDKDLVDVEWPDGSVTQHRIQLVNTSHEISDMGTPFTVQERLAYIVCNHNGAKISLRLAETKAKVRLISRVKYK